MTKHTPCEHKSRRYRCRICNITGFIKWKAAKTIARHVKRYKASKTLGNKTITNIGCTAGEFKAHMEAQFTGRMSWNNYGTLWDVDHIIPVQYKANGNKPTFATVLRRLHYTNTQPMLKAENRRKGNRWIG